MTFHLVVIHPGADRIAKTTVLWRNGVLEGAGHVTRCPNLQTSERKARWENIHRPDRTLPREEPGRGPVFHVVRRRLLVLQGYSVQGHKHLRHGGSPDNHRQVIAAGELKIGVFRADNSSNFQEAF